MPTSPHPFRPGMRRVSHAVTVLAGLLVLGALLCPNQITELTPGAFVRLPVEALVGAAVLLALPARVRRVGATLAGIALGLVTVMKLLDMGFYTVLARQFDPVLDWTLLDDAVNFLTDSVGRAGALGAVIGAATLAAAIPVVVTLSVLRLARLVERHDGGTPGIVTALTAAWVSCALLGVQLVPGVPVTASSTAGIAYDRVLQVHTGLRNQQVFAAQAAVDAYRNTPGRDLLAGLRGKDVVFSFVESYGRDAVENPRYAAQIGAVLDAGSQRLGAAGYAARSAYLTAPTAGGNSWLAHATFLSGLWVDNQQRYRTLVSGDRLTLTSAFRRAGWETVAVEPGVTYAWPEGTFYGYDRVYDSRNIGYRGPSFSWATMPDQFTLSAFERAEHARTGRAPVMAEITLVSSHTPWAPIPRLIDWDDVGDGSIFGPMAAEGDSPEVVWRDDNRVRTEYRRSIEYSLNSLISYVETYGDDNLVLVFLGDHQPAPLITGTGASRDVPVTIVARDPAVLDQISGWGWHDGLKPGPQAPTWRMDAFRDRFLQAYSGPTSPAATS